MNNDLLLRYERRVDELKVKRNVDQTEVAAAQKQLLDYIKTLPLIHQKLLQPVPDITEARSKKPNYRSVEIDANSEQSHEPLVPLRDYGVACRAYYSRDNEAIGPVEGVPPDVYVRETIAETLAEINQALKQEDVTSFFGSSIELCVDEGYRSPELQQHLYTTVIPDIIRKELKERGTKAEELEDEVKRERDMKSAKPPTSPKDTPSPHATGAAIDLNLRYVQDTLDHVKDVDVDMGREKLQMTTLTNPDHFEHETPVIDKERVARRNRRALYAIMTGKAFGLSTRLVPNPTEYWHWSRGDQLSTITTGEEKAVYGWPDQAFKN